ncbi:SGNH/GDSL hydrolase family protein [Kiritimatiellaeota bacterium B1221]|nr:SGNH/GDSL hydrolase family protein [Kiritimatiellaeota bacterium B1221]
MKIFLIGDSISVQYGPYLEAHLKGVMHYAHKKGLNQALRDLNVPQGANSGDSGRVLNFLETHRDAAELDVDLILLNCGLHDIKRDAASGKIQVPIDQYRKNLEQIVRQVEAMQPSLVWISTTPCDE